jgi:hypothetical protein
VASQCVVRQAGAFATSPAPKDLLRGAFHRWLARYSAKHFQSSAAPEQEDDEEA